MKKLVTIAFALLLGASLSFAQAGGGSTDKGTADKSATTDTGKKGKTKTHSKKGAKKSKKSSSDTTTPPPK
ncbi:MAG TPA: hypothetical protein VGH51_10865 [Candidatus Angelobacter sp.]|jgi:hypothetical protein